MKQFLLTADSSRRSRIIILLVTLIVLSVYFTFPICFAPARPMMKGGDFYLNNWILSWGIHQIGKHPLDLYNANIFFPARDALAFSDNMLANSVIAAPAYIASHNPIIAYNFLVIVSLLIGGLGTYLLAYRLTGNFYAALVAAVFYDFSATRMSRMVQIQLFTSHWTPFALLYLHKFFEKPTFKNIFLLALFFTLQALSGAYNTVYLFSAIAIGTIFFLISEKRYKDSRFYVRLLLLAIVSFALVFPFFWPYLKNAQELGMVRPSGSMYRLSPPFRSYLAIPTGFYLWITSFSKGLRSYLFSQSPFLFPGLAPLLLTFATFAYRRAERTQIFYLLLALFALIASAGPALYLYSFLFRYVLIFRMMRVPSRFTLLLVFCLAILSAYGIRVLMQRYRETGKRAYLYACAILPLFFVVESSITPIRTVQPDTLAPVYGWLKDQPRNVVITEIPFRDPYQADYMFYSIAHWKTLTNGYSGYTPRYAADFTKRLETFPDPASVRKIMETSDYLIVHKALFGPEQITRIQAGLQNFQDTFKLIGTFGSDDVYQVQTDFHGMAFAKFYPFYTMRGRRLSFVAKSMSSDSNVPERISILLNRSPVTEVPVSKYEVRHVIDLPANLLHYGSNKIDFFSGKRPGKGDPRPKNAGGARRKGTPFRLQELKLVE